MEQQFEAFFKRADLDGDGRISGAEAVSFFQGSNLPKPVLAQIWMHADKAHTGFLGRAEFYNALKLVTVAQSKRDLTPEIVNAALYGPASAKIPPPKMNMDPLPAPNANSTPVTSAPQRGALSQPASQNAGYGFPSGGQNQSVQPPQVRPLGQTQSSMGLQYPLGANVAGPNVPNANLNNNWGGINSGAATGTRDINSGMLLATSKPQPSGSFPPITAPNDSKALVVVGSNGSASDSIFGGDLFSSKPPAPKQEPSVSALVTSAPSPGITGLASSGVQPPGKGNAFDALQSSFSLYSSNNQGQRPPTPSPAPSRGPSPSGLSGASVGVGNSTPDSNQAPWPKMKPADVQKYSKVFMEVDPDRDGKVSGEQARNLFLSWRLPRGGLGFPTTSVI